MRLSTLYRPGQRVPISGIYAEVDQCVRPVGRNATCVKWEKFPPTKKGGDGYVLVQVTNP